MGNEGRDLREIREEPQLSWLNYDKQNRVQSILSPTHCLARALNLFRLLWIVRQVIPSGEVPIRNRATHVDKSRLLKFYSFLILQSDCYLDFHLWQEDALHDRSHILFQFWPGLWEWCQPLSISLLRSTNGPWSLATDTHWRVPAVTKWGS